MPILAGLDGPEDTAPLIADDCCPPDLCEIDVCTLACALVADLPTGPLWDIPKRTVLTRLRLGEADTPPGECTSIVTYAVTAARHLHYALQTALWTTLRESDPFTAVDTLDDWLERLGWQDCFRCACGCVDLDAGETLAPYELLQPDGTTICCPSAAPVGLSEAVKRATVIALWRLRLGIIPNLDSINFVIASLGAKLVPAVAQAAACCRPGLDLISTAETLPGVAYAPCPRDGSAEPDPVKAWWTLSCDGQGDGRRIYPGLLAAECIVRSILSDMPVALTRRDPI
jgi:hypothetical protein